MQELSVGISPCPNDVYIFSGLILKKVEIPNYSLKFDFQDVETLNLASQQSRYDVLKISAAAYPQCQQAYQYLDCGGALGEACGPLLLTGGADFDPEKEILVPGKLTTANFLLDYCYRGALKKRFLPFDIIYNELLKDRNCQGLVIHEKRFTYKEDELHLIRDLGEFWEQKTASPIPLGLIVVSRKNSHELTNEVSDYKAYTKFSQAIRESLRWAKENEKEAIELCQQYSKDLSPKIISAHISLYVNQYSMELGEKGERALQRLFAHKPHPPS